MGQKSFETSESCESRIVGCSSCYAKRNTADFQFFFSSPFRRQRMSISEPWLSPVSLLHQLSGLLLLSVSPWFWGRWEDLCWWEDLSWSRSAFVLGSLAFFFFDPFSWNTQQKITNSLRRDLELWKYTLSENDSSPPFSHFCSSQKKIYQKKRSGFH